MTKFSSLFMLPVLLAASALAAPFEVKDTQGRPLTIEVTNLDGVNVTFTAGGKEHTLTLDRFDADSQTKIKEVAASLPPQIPKLDVDVSVSNKRQKVGWYQATQTVSQKVILKNLSVSIAYPAAKGYVISIGQNREYTDRYKVMMTSEFDISVPANKSFEASTKPFSTTYDAENKGNGNVGGYQYDSYVFIITDTTGNVLLTKTMDGNLKSQLEKDTSLAKRIIALKKDQLIDKNLNTTEAVSSSE